MAPLPSSMVRRMRWVLASHAARKGTCVVTWMVERRGLQSSMRDSVAPHNCAMYSVCPVNGRPERETASLLIDRKSTRLNSSHLVISYAVFCLKKEHMMTSLAGALCTLLVAPLRAHRPAP